VPRARMKGQAEFFDVDERLRQLSAKGDSLERLNAIVDFELFRRIWNGFLRIRARGAAAHTRSHRAAPGCAGGEN
jgi:hypothetical protein